MSDPEEKLYWNYFLCILEQRILSIEQRFEQLAEHNDKFGFLYNIQTLRSMTADNLKKTLWILIFSCKMATAETLTGWNCTMK
jgi:hypothetical protein